MSSSSISGSNGIAMSVFDEQRDGVRSVAAVVMKRGGDAEWKVTKGIPVLSFIGFMLRFKLRRWFRIKHKSPEFEPMPSGFTSGSGVGAGRIMFSESLRVVRFGDIDYPVPGEGARTFFFASICHALQ